MLGARDGMIVGTPADDLIEADGLSVSIAGDAWVLGDSSAGRNDNLGGSGGDDFIAGDAGQALLGNAVGGDDILLGNAGSDMMKGDAQTMRDVAAGGNDTLYGGDGDDRLQGDSWATYDGASGGDDILVGGAGNDHIYGDSLEYFGSGAGGNDLLYGEEGNDALSGGRGNDVLTGGAGADLFKFINYGDGVDRFTDFNVGEGDRFELEGFGVSFADIDSNGNGLADEADALIYVNAGTLQLDMSAYNTSPIDGTHLAIVDGVTSLRESDFVILPFS